MNREIKLAGATFVLASTSTAFGQPASGAASGPSTGASSVPTAGTPIGGDPWSVAIIGGFVGGIVGGVIVAVVVVGQLKKALGSGNTTQR
jgi:hypothetical protein